MSSRMNSGPELPRDLDGLGAVVGRRHLVAEELQEPRHPAGRVHVVVDDEDSGLLARLLRRS